MAELFTPDALIALLTLTSLEIVLGIDNIVFIAILVGKLPQDQQPRARSLGLSLAMITRILMLLTLGWIMGLTAPFIEIPRFWAPSVGGTFGLSGRDLILLVGGLFLLGKATYEIHDKLEGSDHTADGAKAARASFRSTIIQI